MEARQVLKDLTLVLLILLSRSRISLEYLLLPPRSRISLEFHCLNLMLHFWILFCLGEPWGFPTNALPHSLFWMNDNRIIIHSRLVHPTAPVLLIVPVMYPQNLIDGDHHENYLSYPLYENKHFPLSDRIRDINFKVSNQVKKLLWIIFWPKASNHSRYRIFLTKMAH